jgi:streptogramin lyase
MVSRWVRGSVAAAAATVALFAFGTAAAGAAPTISEYSIPTNDTQPWDVTTGPAGSLWVTEGSKKAVVGITALGAVTEYTSGITFGNLRGITQGPDGNVWFTEAGGSGAIARITPGGTVTEFTAGLTRNSQPMDIVAGPDGNLWFTESAGNGAIGRITPTGTITEFTAGLTAKRSPTDITVGPDGNLWFTESGDPGAIGKITPAGGVTEYRTGLTTNRAPTGITRGSDGNLWFTENSNPGAIGRITPSGTITEFTTGLTVNSHPTGIGTGDDGSVWFTEPGATAKLATIGPSGTITEYAAGLTSNSDPWRIAPGPDGNLWFTEHANPGRIATVSLAPGVRTDAPSATTATTATLAGTVTPNTQSTSYHFEWGATTAYGSNTSTTSAGSSGTPQAVSASISGLSGGATYHYRLVASNASGTTYGRDETFTAQTLPIVETGEAADAALTSATLQGTVNPNSNATTYHFDWGTTAAYGNRIPGTDGAVGSDSAPHAMSNQLTGLTPGVTYHFRVVATSSAGTSLGADQTFTTPMPPPSVTPGAATGVDATGATLNASANPQGSATSYHFDFGVTQDYGATWPSFDAPLGSDSSAHALTQTVSGLAPATTYHYRVVAVSAAGAAYGPDQTFTTAAAPSGGTPLPPTDPGTGTGTNPGGTSLPPAGRPVLGRSVTVAPASGTVLVRLPGSDAYLPLTAGSTIPVGATVDAGAGRVRLANVNPSTGKVERGTFWGAAFKVTQRRSRRAYTELRLAGKLSCPAGAKMRSSRRRRLWGHDHHGRYRTRGSRAVATVRGTEWLTEDTCAGTTVKVKRGAVSVRDLTRKRTVLVRAGHAYRAPRS